MTTNSPTRCAYSGMVQRGTNETVLVSPGSYPGVSNYLTETWTYTSSSTTWNNTGVSSPVPGRINQTMVYDGYNVMVFGGQGSGNGQILNDTWTFNGTAWTKQAPTTSPFGRTDATAAFVSGVGTIVFGGFGGAGNGVFLNETWLWDGYGLTWTQKNPATSPSARYKHCMASDGTNVYMFGGAVSSGEFKNDTWKYVNGNWTQLSPATSPSVRGDAVMCYDTTNSIFVLFGGMNEYNYLPETWTFNGTTWSQVAVANGTGPPGRIGAQMSFDSISGTSLLVGGISATDNIAVNTTWSFNGSTLTWTKK